MLDYALIDALAAVIRHGSFDRAARELKVTQSAVSQRIKLLEERMGGTLIERGQPCRATTIGALLFQHAQTVQLMEKECLEQIPGASKNTETIETPYRIAVNDGRIASWFVDTISEICIDKRFFVELVIVGKDQTRQRIRDGSVHAILTTESSTTGGWTSVSLGNTRYRAVCSRSFYSRHFTDGVNKLSLEKAPKVSCIREDEVQSHFELCLAGDQVNSPLHLVPDALGLLQVCKSGMGWSSCPDFIVSSLLKSGELVELNPSVSVDSELFWQTSRLPMKQLDIISSLLKQRMAAF